MLATSTGNKAQSQLRPLLLLLLLLALILAANSAAAAGAREAAAPEKPAAEAPPLVGQYVEPAGDVLSAKGEVPIEYDALGRPARQLPEELDDGELEGGDHQTAWSYTNQRGWHGEYPLCAGENRRQSPVDILTDQLVFNSRMKLEFVDYNQEVEFEFRNTHHSVSLTPICSLAPPALRLNWVPKSESELGGGSDLYDLQEIHFHWGDGVNKGSEHEINDQKAAAEMHMVHYRRGLDKTKIGNVENSVVVLGVLIESDVLEHNKLEGLVKRSEFVNGTDSEYKDNNPESLINLLPDNHHSFYTYNGSLTTPPCYEVVTWVLMSEPVYMSQQRLVELSNLEAQTAGGRHKIAANHRDIQPLLDRPVYASFNASDTTTYELTSDFGSQKNIGARTGHFSRAIDEYWSRVNQLQVSVKRAFGALASARKRLLERLGARRRDSSAPATQPAQASLANQVSPAGGRAPK